jgi:branched-chain amino acid transport system ATP-binding protein
LRPIATATPALEVDGITRSFGGLVALKKVSFRVNQGEILGLIGPNGAGKSTLFDVVSGGTSPDEGRVKYFGEDITGQPIHERRRRGLCRTYQKVRLFEQLTIEQNVAVAATECTEDRRSWRDHGTCCDRSSAPR